MGADASTAPLGSSKSQKQVPIFHQILIVLHGSRKSGKTSLLRRMNGLNYQPQYVPTKCMQASEIIWHPICMPNESIKIIVWDVVDKAIDPTPQSQRTKQLPDASNVDTFARADGIIVVYDPRDEESIKYARSILDQAPQSKPTLIVMNFADSFETAPSVPSLMEPYTNSFFHLTASMKTNQGLAELANWLDLPMNVSLSRIYELHLKQSEEKLNDLLKEFNLTGLDENQEQSLQLKNKESAKDFWSNEPDDYKDNYGIGSNEVSADFFMDDDESDLKAKQNLEKLKKKLNLAEFNEEESDEEMKQLRMKKKSKILSKHTNNNDTNQSSKLAKPVQAQNQDENEYSDTEYNNEDNDQSKLPQQTSIPQISFDIPIVAENDNSFFEDDKDENKNDMDLENDGVDDKLEELKKKLNLEIPKDYEDDEEKPKAKKSKILPKVKPPQIIIKPAQPKVQQQPKPEIESANPKETENEKNKSNEETASQKLEAPIVSNEKDEFFSDDGKNNEINDNTAKTAEATTSEKINDITFPSFDDEGENDSKNAEGSITSPSFGDENENKVDNNISNENTSNVKEDKNDTTSINIPNISDITLPSFGNDDFFGDDDEKDKDDNFYQEEENDVKQEKIEKKSKILPKKEIPTVQPQIESKSNIADENSLPNSNNTTDTEHKQLPDITFPSFGDDSGFFSDENKNKENEPFSFPSFDDNSNNISTENQTKEDEKITLPSFGDDNNFFADENQTKEEPVATKFDHTLTFPSFNDSLSNLATESKEETQSKSKETESITLPSFGDDSNTITNKNESSKEIDSSKTAASNSSIRDITLPSFDDNTNFFFSDEENEDSKEKVQTDKKGENNILDDEKPTEKVDQVQTKKKPLILPKQQPSKNSDTTPTTTTTTTTAATTSQSHSIQSRSIEAVEQKGNEDERMEGQTDKNVISLDTLDIAGEVNDDSFFTEKPSKPSNEQSITDMPKPPPIDFTSSFLSENNKSKEAASSLQESKNEDKAASDDLDILDAIRKSEAERAKMAAMIEAKKAEAEKEAAMQTEPKTENAAATSSYSMAGDYEAFDDTPRVETKERRHRKHGSSHRSRKHKSGRRGKAEESDGQAGEGENDETYLSFD